MSLDQYKHHVHREQAALREMAAPATPLERHRALQQVTVSNARAANAIYVQMSPGQRSQALKFLSGPPHCPDCDPDCP